LENHSTNIIKGEKRNLGLVDNINDLLSKSDAISNELRSGRWLDEVAVILK
jgi:hypothetical protein